MTYEAERPRASGSQADVVEIRRLLSSADALLAGLDRPQSRERDHDTCPVALAQWLLHARRSIGSAFDPGLFGDPAFDMLLDLFVHEEEGRAVCVSSACVGSGVPATTALRWLAILHADGFVSRTPDPADGRRVLLSLAPATRAALRDWLRRIAERLPASSCSPRGSDARSPG